MLLEDVDEGAAAATAGMGTSDSEDMINVGVSRRYCEDEFVVGCERPCGWYGVGVVDAAVVCGCHRRASVAIFCGRRTSDSKTRLTQ